MKTNHPTILLVDDDPNDLFLLETAFESAGLKARIQQAVGGQEAIDYLSANGHYADRAAHELPHFVITDLKMPDVDGFEVLKFLKSTPELALIPAVVFSGSADNDDIRRAYESGASSYHVKPSDPSMLFTLVKALHAYWVLCELPESADTRNGQEPRVGSSWESVFPIDLTCETYEPTSHSLPKEGAMRFYREDRMCRAVARFRPKELMSQPTGEIYARALIAEESCAKIPSNSEANAALRVCEKLRRPLTTLAGTAGFRSLLHRAVTLAKAKAPWLEELKLNDDGSFNHPPEMEARLATVEAASGAGAVVAHLLGLLITFIGEALTLRLIQDVWPKAALKNLKTSGK